MLPFAVTLKSWSGFAEIVLFTVTPPPLFVMVTGPFEAVIFCRDISPDVVLVRFICPFSLVKEEPAF